MPARPGQEADLRFPSRPAVIATPAALALTSCGTGADSGTASVSLTIAVWAPADVWGGFLFQLFILLRDPEKAPGSVLLYTLHTDGGAPKLDLISTFSPRHSLPVAAMYPFVSHRYGFRFHGGTKA
ncbi:hypothetical protein ABZ912_33495 [Nonomuraea angiospora]|uniref:hypothetical protein n=1 Tax=Nonomuraea angiospora TaxID=46172 RepID=UPI0033DAD92B